MALFSNTVSLLERALDYSAIKQKVISQNIANVDTPNYKAKEVNFKAILSNELSNTVTAKRTDIRHFPFQSSTSMSDVIKTQNTSYNNNGNNVDVDKEMAELATNQIYYNALVERISGKFQTLQTVIRGGNR